ncbi:transcriptional regulatory protein [Bradyrhizobium diazoefficiens USDA 110]|uniref:Transcriptional regulatory protein n=1 Tax=Bradyrhizobium diazoefficiens (strain JCM 10833 / BCRC 13528 / IAM 13628 / NBRC 14792 / USDA 110) TaxID=224911 RepID=Q89DK9_BRADU|nr:transcriptional regulator [Bradyrhizobium diazoefficiens]QBP26171.1 LysR family transcriptional regulator [Bradyrhizobium diazoefficiens]BAC52695.1 transcriptional regulatory protein [Bradyrhizobium diazoefficiens USDA 110]
MAVGLAETPPHPEFAVANSGLSPQAGRGEEAASRSTKSAWITLIFLPRLLPSRKLSYLALASAFLRVGHLRRLLFLNGIKAFEAAARTGSFAAAGVELNVSAAAVSRMVHLLEERLGVALFERKANRLVLTQAGRAYQSGLTPIFDALASLTAQVTAPSSVRVLTIGVGHTFAMRWLIPRLSEFRNEEPDIEVRFTTGGASVPFGEDWSCGIKLGTGDWPGLVAEPLFAGDLTPVCVPRLAASLKRPADLRGPSLIRVAHSAEDWPIWLKAANLARINARGPEFQFYGQALQAAADGLGIAMGIRPYIDDDLAAGRLVAPFDLSVPKGMRWYLVYRSFQTEQRDFAAFRRWIMRAASEPAARPARRTGRTTARN